MTPTTASDFVETTWSGGSFVFAGADDMGFVFSIDREIAELNIYGSGWYTEDGYPCDVQIKFLDKDGGLIESFTQSPKETWRMDEEEFRKKFILNGFKTVRVQLI